MGPRTLLVPVLAATAAACAQVPQTQGTVTYSMEYLVFVPGSSGWATAHFTHSTVVSEGQAVLFMLRMSMSGTPRNTINAGTGLPAGSPQTWNPVPTPPGSYAAGSSGAGGLAGFWSGNINVMGDNGASTADGVWSDNSTAFALSIRRRVLVFTAGNGHGLVNGAPVSAAPAPGVTDIQPAQFTPDPGALNDVDNVIVWRGLWIPSSYTPRTVQFRATIGSLGFLSQIGAMDNTYSAGYRFPIDLEVQTNFAPAIGIGIVPAPAGLALLGLGGLTAARRRRELTSDEIPRRGVASPPARGVDTMSAELRAALGGLDRSQAAPPEEKTRCGGLS